MRQARKCRRVRSKREMVIYLENLTETEKIMLDLGNSFPNNKNLTRCRKVLAWSRRTRPDSDNLVGSVLTEKILDRAGKITLETEKNQAEPRQIFSEQQRSDLASKSFCLIQNNAARFKKPRRICYNQENSRYSCNNPARGRQNQAGPTT